MPCGRTLKPRAKMRRYDYFVASVEGVPGREKVIDDGPAILRVARADGRCGLSPGAGDKILRVKRQRGEVSYLEDAHSYSDFNEDARLWRRATWSNMSMAALTS